MEKNNPQHSPGPWYWYAEILRPAAGSERIHTIINDDGCTVYRDTPVDEFQAEHEANKLLIAAAPELLAALQSVVENWTSQFESEGHAAPEWCKQARAAIAKATVSAE